MKLSRRELFHGVAATAAAKTTGVFADRRPKRRPKRRPNILLIVIDDLGKEGLAPYYRRIYDTPNIDRLAREGATFTSFYTQPLCAPSRAVLVTGKYPFRTGWTYNTAARPAGERWLDPAHGSFVELLRQRGYRTMMAGKWHLAYYNEDPDHPFRFGFDTWQGTGYGHWGPRVWRDGVVVPELEDPEIFGSDTDVDQVVDFIGQRSKRPFFAYFPCKLVHKPFVETPATRGTTGLEEGDPRLFPEMIRYMDAQVGRLLDAVDDRRLAKNTLVMFTTDNGTTKELGGKKGGFTEGGINNPFILRWPRVMTPGDIVNAFCDLTDIGPTLLDAAGADPLDGDGHSLLPFLLGQEEPPRRWVYADKRDRYMIRDERWKLTNDGGLYDVTNDIWEVNPIYSDSDDDLSGDARLRLESQLEDLWAS